MRKCIHKLALSFCLVFAVSLFACAPDSGKVKESDTGSGNQEQISAENETTTKPVTDDKTQEGKKENKAAEARKLLSQICESNGVMFSVENNFGTGKQSEVMSMQDINACMDLKDEIKGVTSSKTEYRSIFIENYLFNSKLWYEVTESDEQTKLSEKKKEGFLRFYSDDKNEFILLKTTNGAIYSSEKGTKYYLWYNSDGKQADLTDFCNMWYDNMAYFGAGNEKLVNISIDAENEKSRETLAYELMEAYRAYSSSVAKDNGYYFDTIKIISLKSYSESDSSPDSNIGEITKDILKFEVTYAINSDDPDDMLAGSWSEGEGEYKGYMINSCRVTAIRHNGRWYCVSMGNG